jgi:hypothetical protein
MHEQLKLTRLVPQYSAAKAIDLAIITLGREKNELDPQAPH